MRYIKEYNKYHSNTNFLNEKLDNEFFEKVGISEFRKFIKSKKELDRDSSLIIYNKIKETFRDRDLEFDDKSFYGDNSISFNAEEKGVDILLFDDEWFAVSIITFGKGKQDYFICDQFEGLVKLLEIELNFKPITEKIDSESNDYYWEISPNEYGSTIEEYDDNPWEMVGKIRKILPNVEYTSINTTDNKISFNTPNARFDIKFIKDEWFKLKYNGIDKNGHGSKLPSFYKCDQFEGLIRLFKDLGLKVNERVIESKLDRPNYKKLDIDGFIVYQGKDAKSNDYVTFELSDDEDYWLHAKGVPGSHILIKTKDKVPSIDIIKKAAQIAAKNSKSDKNDVNVVYCKKKFVRKERGMNDGQVKVDYKNSYEITVSKK